MAKCNQLTPLPFKGLSTDFVREKYCRGSGCKKSELLVWSELCHCVMFREDVCMMNSDEAWAWCDGVLAHQVSDADSTWNYKAADGLSTSLVVLVARQRRRSLYGDSASTCPGTWCIFYCNVSFCRIGSFCIYGVGQKRKPLLLYH